MIVQTVLTWYRQTWWVGTKEVLILLGFLVAAFTYRHNTTVRARNIEIDRLQRTYELMKDYPGTTRDLVLHVRRQLDDGFQAIDRLRAEGVNEDRLRELQRIMISESDLVTLLHRLDPWGFLLRYQKFVSVDDALSTFASEVQPILLDRRLNSDLKRILKSSTMEGIPTIRVLLYLHQMKRRKRRI